jgi:glutathione S-transferase
MLRLHGHELSGNSYKVRLLLELLGVPYEWVRVDLIKGEHKSEVALAGDGGIDLAPYPHVRAWIARIQGLPGYRPMKGLHA